MKRRQYLSGLVAASGLAVAGVSTASAGETIASWDDPKGDDAGPGNYTYPTTDEIPEGAFDLANFSIGANGDRYTFSFTFQSELSNNWDGSNGFSHQHIQVYLADPSADGGSTESAEGPNVTFSTAYHHRLVITPFPNEMPVQLEDPSGEVVTDDVEVSTEGGDTIVASVPQDSLDYLEDGHVVPLVTGWDGYGPGSARAVSADGGEWEFGGGDNDNAPRVIDLVTPDGTSQEDALAYSGDGKASVPLLSISGDDSGGDDSGSDDSGSDDSGSDDSGGDDSSSDDSGSDDSGSDDSSSDDSGSDDSGSDGSDSDDGLPGFGVAAGVAGTVGGALAAKRAGDEDEE